MKIIKPKYYLNKRLKPKKVGSVDAYPVYFRFTIGKNNHRIKSFLVEYLTDEDELKDYKKEIDLEKEVINYLYNRFHNYSFANFNSDAFYLCNPLSVLVSLYIHTHVDEFEDQEALELYKVELRDYLFSTSKFPIPFLNGMVESITFNSLVPSGFIENKNLKLIIDSYNSSVTFNEKSPSVFCMFNWLHTDIKDTFLKIYGQSHFKFIDKIVKLYSTSINPSLVDN
ncbi:hypothetical protein [Gelidibacter mesophilus]|uniref:hypothetical protein n=1 Tax=Gelidibacter mesophilus TaxID=169050 RepID=UPI00041CA7F3|nr:hypothetical protein [Gelidibacter mesophilus]